MTNYLDIKVKIVLKMQKSQQYNFLINIFDFLS